MQTTAGDFGLWVKNYLLQLCADATQVARV